MAKRQSTGSGGKRAQGGGRTPNSEPKVQLFKDFGGVNFELADRFGSSVDTPETDEGDQTDLQMNFTYLQNNVSVASNKTLETRDDLVTLFKAPQGTTFTGPVRLIGPKLYAAKSNGSVGRGDLDEVASRGRPMTIATDLALENNTGSGHTWTSLGYYDDKLIAMTSQNEIWTGAVSGYTASSLANARQVPDPTVDMYYVLHPRGSLKISRGMTQECPFRVIVCMTYVNKYGPTKASPNTVFYANTAVTEWHAGCYMNMSATVPIGYGIQAIELYYATDNAMEPIFLGRADVADGAGQWSFDWYGYIDATSMWPMGNLLVPSENYTKGVHASRVTDIDGKLYFWGDSSAPYRVYMGGNPGNLLSVSPGTGGGFVDIEPGTGQKVKHVCKYKTQSGNSIVTMLCASPNTRKDQRYNLVENSIALSNEQSMKSWQAEQVAGAVGCKSLDGALVCQDGLYSIVRYGLALTTMTMEYNAQIRTNYVSDPVKPAFVDAVSSEERLGKAMILEVDGVIYLAMGTRADEEGNLDNVLFCYDIDMKAWWTCTLDVEAPILGMFHVDWQGQREGIGIVTADRIYMLPTTVSDDSSDVPSHTFLIETGQLSTQMPQQGWQYLSQLEFHFDRFVGEMDIELRMVDLFGRTIRVRKHVSEEELQYDYHVRMRVDQRVMSYVITMTGTARFRMSHFLARVYTMSNKVSQVWGFDDSISHRSAGSVHPTFKSYNDVRRAIFT